jgi:hypothetical protein
MRFRYAPLATRLPIYPLGGALVRHRPLLAIEIAGPLGSRVLDASVDSGADDTLFPEYLAPRLGVDLAKAPEGGEGRAVGGAPIAYRYAFVTLRLTDSYEECQWEAIAGFVAAPMRWPVLGHAGVLQYFDVQLLGARHEVIFTPNPSFAGRHLILRPSRP